MATLAPSLGETIVDIGCGTGQTVIQLADRVGSSGRVLGVDISPLVLRVARDRASHLGNVSHVEGDATTLELAVGSADASSRGFGVMASAGVAFSDFHRLFRDNGRIAFVCWRSLAENGLGFPPLSASGLEYIRGPTLFSFGKPENVRLH